MTRRALTEQVPLAKSRCAYNQECTSPEGVPTLEMGSLEVIRLRWPPQYVRTHPSCLASTVVGRQEQEECVGGGARTVGELLM